MIVRGDTRGLILITQPDHAALSRRIMEQWKPLDGAGRRVSILHAIAEHDNGWREPDASPTVDPATGRIHDFVSTPKEIREAIWPRGIGRLAGDPWAAALVAQHAITVYDRFRADPTWREFFAEMERLREHYTGSAGGEMGLLMEDYDFLRLGDLASLVFCNGWADEHRWGDYRMRLEGSRLHITPDPFEGRELAIEVSGRRVPDRFYESDADASEAYRSAGAAVCAGVVAGGMTMEGAGRASTG